MLILLFLSTRLIRAQEDAHISGNFNKVSFKAFAKSVELQTDYSIFYDSVECENLVVDLVVDGLPIHDVLTKALVNTDFYYVVDDQKNVFITKGFKISDRLPDDFFYEERKLDLKFDRGRENKNNGRIDFLPKEDVVQIGKNPTVSGSKFSFLAGYIRDKDSGEPVIGATVFVERQHKAVMTDQYGHYSISLPTGLHELKIRSAGMKEYDCKIMINSDGNFDIELTQEITFLKEVVVESGRDINVSGMQMGFEKLDIKALRKVSTVMGEVDVLRVLLSLPGVQTVGEATTGLNVRGGSADQNLIRYNGAVVYNPTHLFGFFTAFNPDAVKSVELLKSGMPAEYGGRLSSVIDITSREGNKKKFVGTGGIGPLSGKFTFEGPIIKDKTSFLVGVRSMYSNWLLRKVPNEAVQNSSGSFYDLNFGINHQVNEKNNVYLSFYKSKDGFKFNGDSLYRYHNNAASAKWKHYFSNTLNGIFGLSFSGYGYSVSSDDDPASAFELTHSISQAELKADFNLVPFSSHTFSFGLNSTYYFVRSGRIKPISATSLVAPDEVQDEMAFENALYAGDHFELNSKLSFYAGIRYSFFNALGPRDVRLFAEGLPRIPENIIDTVRYASGSTVAFYHGPELRASVKYLINQSWSIKASYNRIRQYLHMLSNTTSISPTDVWKLSDSYIAPQIGDQISIGMYKNFRSGMIETSIETYVKDMKNSLDYKDGADLIVNHAIETDVLKAKGVAYGTELMIKKSTGKLNGWISYSYARSFLRTTSSYKSETVNNGEYYPSNYDKPHTINLIGNYSFTHRVGVSIGATYSTGRPITLPLAKYEIGEASRLLYSERNQYRVEDYFRIDFSVNIEGNHKIKKLAHSSWTFGIYNLTGRKNVYSVFFRSNEGVVRGYRLSVFGAPIPSITYNFRF